MKKNVILIFDPAHGVNILGKCSPDGTHREYTWSRERIKALKTICTSLGYEVYVTTDSENEPGLSKRRNFATQIRKGKRKILISLHNNAKGADGKWHDARGFAIYTTKGVTKADTCADIIFKQFQEDFPNLKARMYKNANLERDFEENFTVLMGADYMGVLIEWLFQDNLMDVELLKDPETNKRFEDSLVKAIEKINGYFAK